MLFVDLASHLGIRIERIAYFDALKFLHERRYEFIVDALLHKNSTSRAADLALVEKNSQLHAVDRNVEVAIVKDDICALAAKLKRSRDELLRRG